MTTQELDLIKEEYRRLSQEINIALSHRLQIVQFGLTFTGILVGFALQYTGPISTEVVWAFMIPVACLMILYLWLSEVRRARRASWYIFGLERRVNSELQTRVLRWEEDIRKQGLVFRFHYYSTVVFFILVSLFASIYGMLQSSNMPNLFRIGWPLGFGAFIIWNVGRILYDLTRYDDPSKSWPEAVPDKPAKVNRKEKNPAK